MSPQGWFDRAVEYAIIVVALGAGLAASYGREREAERKPDRHWWLNRVLILPVLAITSSAATEAFSLSKSMAAFTAAMLALGGYDALCLIEAKWRARAKAQMAPQLARESQDVVAGPDTDARPEAGQAPH